jgi:hypothetical protein
MKVVCLLAATVLLSGCFPSNTPTQPTLTLEQAHARICGNYQGSYAGGIERFQIQTNGVFVQEFSRNDKVVYRLEGKWELFQRAFQGADSFGLTFRPWMSLQDALYYGKPPKKSDGMTTIYYGDESTIWFDRDMHYYVNKLTDSKGK